MPYLLIVLRNFHVFDSHLGRREVRSGCTVSIECQRIASSLVKDGYASLLDPLPKVEESPKADSKPIRTGKEPRPNGT